MTRLERPARHYRTHADSYREADSPSAGGRLLVTAGLALLIALLVGAASARQVSSPGRAPTIIAAGIGATTDVDGYLAANEDAIRELADHNPTGAISLPAYPLPVTLSREEARTLPREEMAAVILERSAAAVYVHGLGAFDQTGNQSTGLLSIQGTIDLVVGQIDEGMHTRAEWAAAVLTVLAAVAACVLVLLGEGWDRMRRAGVAVSLGGLVALVPSALLYFAAGTAGGDPYGEDLRELLRTILMVPVRNAIIVLLAGLGVIAAAEVLRRAERMTAQSAPADSASFDPAHEEWDEGEAHFGT